MCFSRGTSPGEALAVLSLRTRRYLDWLAEFEPVPDIEGEFAVVEEVPDPHGPVKRGGTRALFAWDRHAPTKEEFDHDLRWRAHHRRTLLALVKDLPPEALDREEDGPDIYALCTPSIRRILRHIAGAEYWYLTRIPTQIQLPPEELHDVFTALSRIRAAAELVVHKLPATAPRRWWKCFRRRSPAIGLRWARRKRQRLRQAARLPSHAERVDEAGYANRWRV